MACWVAVPNAALVATWHTSGDALVRVALGGHPSRAFSQVARGGWNVAVLVKAGRGRCGQAFHCGPPIPIHIIEDTEGMPRKKYEDPPEGMYDEVDGSGRGERGIQEP